MRAVRFFRYVRHENIFDYMQLGWLYRDDLGPVHGRYSCLMEWLCDCKMCEPKA